MERLPSGAGGLPSLPRSRNLAPLPKRTQFAAMPTGPREFAHRLDPEIIGGPGTPPQGFVRATTSGSEWVLYWALYQVLEPTQNPRQPPFFGSKDPAIFAYQYAYDQGRHRPGGAVVDYVLFPYADRNAILVRLQTERWHIFAPVQKQAYDRLQAQEIGKYGEVYDVFEQQIIADKTGLAAIMAVRDCIDGRLEPNPLLTGQAKRIR